LQGIVDAVPNFEWKVEHLFTEDTRIAARLHDSGTPVKSFLGHEPTGASLSLMEYDSYRVENGLFVDMRFLLDAATADEQLKEGRVPSAAGDASARPGGSIASGASEQPAPGAHSGTSRLTPPTSF
jgi:hypothetical protein